MYKVLVKDNGLIAQIYSPPTLEAFPQGSTDGYGHTYIDYEGDLIAFHTHYWSFTEELWKDLPEKPYVWSEWNSTNESWDENTALKVAAQKTDIKRIQSYWNDITQIYTTVGGNRYHSFDIDIQKMMRAEEYWDDITTKTSEGKILWKDYDNVNHELTREEFAAIISSIKRAKAINIDKIYAYAQNIKASLTVKPVSVIM